MLWKNYEYGGGTYDLSHLHPRSLQFERPAKGAKPAEIFVADVIFSLHRKHLTDHPSSANSIDG
jgi:hypothetical protein